MSDALLVFVAKFLMTVGALRSFEAYMKGAALKTASLDAGLCLTGTWLCRVVIADRNDYAAAANVAGLFLGTLLAAWLRLRSARERCRDLARLAVLTVNGWFRWRAFAFAFLWIVCCTICRCH